MAVQVLFLLPFPNITLCYYPKFEGSYLMSMTVLDLPTTQLKWVLREAMLHSKGIGLTSKQQRRLSDSIILNVA